MSRCGATLASDRSSSRLLEALIGSVRFDTRAGPLDGAALAGLFADIAIEPRRRGREETVAAGLAAWSGSRYAGRVKARADASGVPFLLLGHGLLRAPPGWGSARPVLSAT